VLRATPGEPLGHIPTAQSGLFAGIALHSDDHQAHSMVYPLAKRVLDLSCSMVLTLVAWPIMGLVALSVRSFSAGPVLFCQQRVGKGGRLFTVYKFRTMVTDSPTSAPKPQTRHDNRVTRIGGFLRRTSLDELPQLLNVIKGEMSLVGPRPEQPFLVEQYQDWQRERLQVLPGMTGWWQINGRKQPMHEHVGEDLFYVRNRSFLLDLQILVRTAGVVLARKGAV
jgi:lipopolysaccharide/colanic/teichoic acid biosynthesis glycosyltransferase